MEKGGGPALLISHVAGGRRKEGDCKLWEKILNSNCYKSCLQNTYKQHKTVRLPAWLTDWLPTDWMKLMKVYWALIEALAGCTDWQIEWLSGYRFVESFNEFCQLSGNGNNAPTFCNVLLLNKAVQVRVWVCVWKDFARGVSETFQLCVSLLKHFSFSQSSLVLLIVSVIRQRRPLFTRCFSATPLLFPSLSFYFIALT